VPQAQATTASGNEDSFVAIQLSGTDSDGAVSKYKITSLPTNGTLYLDSGLTKPVTTNPNKPISSAVNVPVVHATSPISDWGTAEIAAMTTSQIRTLSATDVAAMSKFSWQY
jgi:hypothetical protein